MVTLMVVGVIQTIPVASQATDTNRIPTQAGVINKTTISGVKAENCK